MLTLLLALLRALPDLLFLWRRNAELKDKETLHEDLQTFRQALVNRDADTVAALLERRLREARDVSGR